MNWLDAAMMAAIIWFTFAAFQAGFIRETVTVVAAVIGVILAGFFYKDLAEDVLLFIDNDQLARIVAFGVIFGATALAGQLMALVLKPTATLFQLGIFDQLAGAGFGFFKALVFLQIFILVFVTYPRWGIDDAIDESFIGSMMVENVTIMERVLPDEFQIGVDNFTSRLATK